MADATAPSIRIGTSGWAYSSWRGVFYPPEVERGAELSFFSGVLNSVELNGSFYSLQHPSSYQRWYEQTPPGFVFSVKGSRFITHRKQLREVRTALANFLASGVLALREKLGPVLWQLPPRMEFDAERLVEFFRLLPRTTGEAAELARQHDERLTGRTHLQVEADRPLRHALEPRHPSFATAAVVELLREHDIGLVVSDSGGKWPYFEDVTSDFVYVRLHGAEELYVSGYTSEQLDHWAELVLAWHRGRIPDTGHAVAPPPPPRSGRDVLVYFDNDVEARAPLDAVALAQRCGVHTGRLRV